MYVIFFYFLVRPEELESPTFGSVDQRSIQLSYGRILNCMPLLTKLGTKGFCSGPPKSITCKLFGEAQALCLRAILCHQQSEHIGT